MIKLKAGYIIDEIFELFYKQKKFEDFEEAINEFTSYCYFKLDGFNNDLIKENTDELDKSLLVAYNIINRGTPTRASIGITKKILSSYNYKISTKEAEAINFNLNSVDLINFNQTLVKDKHINNSNNDVFNCIYIPILIAQIQKSFLLLWLNGIIDFK